MGGPARVNVLAAGSTSLTVTLEAAPAAAVDVVLTSGDAASVQVPASVTVPAGSATATVTAAGGSKLGVVPVSAAIGDRSVSSSVRVYGVILSEVLYDVTGTDGGWEWIELYNATSVPLDTTGMKVQVAGVSQPIISAFVDSLALPANSIPAHGCVVIGGPSTGTNNFTATGFGFYQLGPFAPNLGNAGSASTDPGDGLQLVTADGKIVDNLLYGYSNSDHIADENGDIPTTTDVGRAGTAKTIERTSAAAHGTWRIASAPSPGDCSAIVN